VSTISQQVAKPSGNDAPVTLHVPQLIVKSHDGFGGQHWPPEPDPDPSEQSSNCTTVRSGWPSPGSLELMAHEAHRSNPIHQHSFMHFLLIREPWKTLHSRELELV
jgi:hypothetical protein